ncbi:MAG: 6-bladed beta-propeller [Marinifilaceae bacterium]
MFNNKLTYIMKLLYRPCILMFLILCSCNSKVVTNANLSLFEEEQSNITPNTTIIDISRPQSRSMKLSALMHSIQYVTLDQSPDASLTTIVKMELMDTLLYIQDWSNSLKCFTKTGTFVRDCYVRGRARNEVTQFHDFTVDSNYLYILDRGTNRVLRFNHEGEFIQSDKLPFRASNMCIVDDAIVFNIDPYVAEKGENAYKITITDTNFNIRYQCISWDNDVKHYRMMRSNHFGSKDCEYYSPILGNGIYKMTDSCFNMEYYIKFAKDYDTKKELKNFGDILLNDYYPIHNNAIHTQKHIYQYLGLGHKYWSLLIIDRETKEYAYIDRFENDRNDILDIEAEEYIVKFDFGEILGYNLKSNEFYGVMDTPSRSMLDQADWDYVNEKIDTNLISSLIVDDDAPRRIVFFAKSKGDVLNNLN